MTKPKEISLAEFARLLDLSPQRVSDYVREGMPCSPARGKGQVRYVNFKRASAWLVRREVARHLAADGGESSASAARRLAVAKADQAELRAVRLANSLIARAVVDALLDKTIEIASKCMNTLPDTLADRIAAESSPAAIRQMIFTEARRVRDRMSVEFARRAAEEEANDGR